jgi:hypothetical protein
MGIRAAARTVAKPFRFTQVPVVWKFWQCGGRWWVVHRAENGIPGQPLSPIAYRFRRSTTFPPGFPSGRPFSSGTREVGPFL